MRRIAIDRDKVADWDAYPFSVPVIATLKSLDFKSRVTCFVGENGSGKSTLLEALAMACGFDYEGGNAPE